MKLSNNSVGVIIWSEDYQKLAKWYEETLGFKVKSKQNIPGDVYVAFELGKNYFSIGEHSWIQRRQRHSSLRRIKKQRRYNYR